MHLLKSVGVATLVAAASAVEMQYFDSPPWRRTQTLQSPHELELELIQSHMAQPMLRSEVGCACVAREVSVEKEKVWASAGVQGAWVGGCGCEAD